MKVGILGGTFDPIHIGHLIAASEVHSELKLDTVVFLPAGQPWQKQDREISAAADRLAMVAAAVHDDDRFTVSDMEVVRSGPTYAIDSVKQWLLENPTDQIYWVVGSDALVGITTWHKWEEFTSLVTVVSVNRSGHTEQVPFDHISIAMPEVRISATDLRERFATGTDTRYLTPEAVRQVVLELGLYKS
jgi:nicotinate-nucleotide adenylyltransferase